MITATQTCKCLIGGQWIEPKTDRYGDVHNPSTGEVIATVPLCSPVDVDAAVHRRFT